MNQTKPNGNSEILDSDTVPIQYSEEYRRSKRNVLFWGTALLLVVVGSPAPGSNIEVEGIIHNLTIPPGTLIFGISLILVFMLFGYVRADRRLVARHTEFAIENRLFGSADMAERLYTSIKIALDSSEKYEMAFSNFGEHKDIAVQNLSENIRQRLLITKLRPKLLDRQPFQDLLYSSNENESLRQKVETAAKDAENWANFEIDKLADDIEDIVKSEVDRQNLVTFAKHIDEASPFVKDNIEKLSILSEKLEGFAGYVSKNDRRWFIFYDRGIVYLLFSFSIISAIIRLIYKWIPLINASSG